MTSRILVCNKSGITNKDLRASLGSSSQDIISFDNKYFSVDVQLVFDTATPVEEIAETVEAFVYVVDEPESAAQLKSVLLDIDSFKEFLADVDPTVRLLLINAAESRWESDFLEWCVGQGFEFIKYVTSEDVTSEGVTSSPEEDGMMGSLEGMGRVREALECHMWPYRTMRTNKPPEEYGEYVSNSTGGAADSTLADFSSLLEGEDLSEASFESLFSNMARIKDVAGQLPGEERRRFAEEVALSFYRAMGGSEDEADT